MREMKKKILLRDFNIIIDKMARDGGNKTQRLFRYRSKGPGSTLISKLLTVPELIT